MSPESASVPEDPLVLHARVAGPLGACHVAVSEFGVLRVSWPEVGERDFLASLRRSIGASRRFAVPEGDEVPRHDPERLLENAERALATWSRRTAEWSFLEPLPLDLRGGLFQRRVWTALRKLRPGSLLPRAGFASRLGHAGKERAVAKAVVENPIPFFLPCHRVMLQVGEDLDADAASQRLRLLRLEGFQPFRAEASASRELRGRARPAQELRRNA